MGGITGSLLIQHCHSEYFFWIRGRYKLCYLLCLLLLVASGCDSDKLTYDELKAERYELLYRLLQEKDKLQEKEKQLEDLKIERDQLLQEKEKLQEKIKQLEETIKGRIIHTTLAEGGTIAAGGTLTIVFDNAVEGVTVTPGFTVNPSVDGITWTATVGKDVKSGAFTIAWKNKDGSSGGPKTLNLKVRHPDVTAPKVVSSIPKDGEVGIDPGRIAKITIEFDEGVASVSGVKLEVVGGGALQTKSEVLGKILTITFLGNAKLLNGTKYEITGKAKDASGNESDFKVTFETRR